MMWGRRAVRAFSSSSSRVDVGKRFVLIDGVRTPFLHAGTAYKGLMAHDLQRHAITSLMNKVAMDKKKIGYVCCGVVNGSPDTTNVAREALLGSGLNDRIPAHTVVMACVSGQQAVASSIGFMKMTGTDFAIAGGVEFLSDPPLRTSRFMRQMLIQFPKAKTTAQKWKLLSQMRPKHLLPDVPRLTEFSTNETMGHSADRLAAAFGVSRADQDDFALRSNQAAFDAAKRGDLSDVAPFQVPNVKKRVEYDNVIRVSTKEKLAKLKPVFVKPHGTITAANSSALTDGASACLIATEDKAKELGLKPKAYISHFTFTAQDPIDQLLLGPAYSTAKILKDTGMGLNDFDVFEIHEAFAAQVLANLAALNSEYFTQKVMGLSAKVGEIPMAKLNNWGGSISLGHPFAATGVRLLMHTANRLIKEDGRFGLASACAQAGIGSAIVLERHPDATHP